ncbi:hypothetical protein FRB93_013243 [Tulasnella sp. JGI-2019a]|nr:hypothetical protein FRB93_013243 [Tulasnella sp. JGI-2019a]
MASTTSNISGKRCRENELDSETEADLPKLNGSAKHSTGIVRMYNRPLPSKMARMTESTSAFSLTTLSTEMSQIEVDRLRQTNPFASMAAVPTFSTSPRYTLTPSTIPGITSGMSHVRISTIPIPPMPIATTPIPATTLPSSKPGRSEFLEWYAPKVKVVLSPPPLSSSPWYQFNRIQKEERRLQEQLRSRPSPAFSPLAMHMANTCTKERHLDHGRITLSRVDEATKAMIGQLPREAFEWSGAFPGRTETREIWASSVDGTGGKVVCHERRCLGHRGEGDVIVTVTVGSPGGC